MTPSLIRCEGTGLPPGNREFPSAADVRFPCSECGRLFILVGAGTIPAHRAAQSEMRSHNQTLFGAEEPEQTTLF